MAQRKPTVVQRATISQVADLNQIDAFVRVMDAGSFTAAARTLGVPKSSVSRAVSKLEQQLGVQLLQRTTRKLAITDEGQRYLEQARSALSILTEAQARLREEGSEPRGLVRVTAPPDNSDGFWAASIVDFTKRYPGIHVEMLLTTRRVDLVAESVDLAVRAMHGTHDSQLVGRRIGDTPLGLVASPAYLAARGTPKRLAQLSEHECVLFRGVRGGQRWSLTGKRGVETVQVKGAISVDDLAYVFNFALRDAGIALVPLVVVQESLRAGKLLRVLPSYRQEGPAVFLLHPAMPHMPRRVALLRDHLFEALKKRYASC